MEEETKDQDQTEAPVEAPKGPKTLKKESTPAEQSTEKVESDKVLSKAYKIEFPDGTSRDMTPDELYEHYQKIGPEFNRKSQELAEYKRQQSETEARNKRTAEESVSKSTLLENVDPSVRDAIVQIVSPVIQEALGQRDKAEEAKRVNEREMKRLDDLEKKYPGKFNKLEILRKMQDPANEIYDPEVLYRTLHWDDYLDEQITAAMKGKSGGTTTESTSTEAPKKPGETTPAKSFSEATKRAMSRI